MHVFPIELEDTVTALDGGDHQLILQKYVTNCVRNPDTWSNPEGRFAWSAVCCALHFDPQARRLYIVSVWSQKRKYGNWAFLGGDILPHMDVNLMNAAKREFVEDAGTERLQKCVTLRGPHVLVGPMCFFLAFAKRLHVNVRMFLVFAIQELMPFGIQKEDIFTNDDGEGEGFIFWGQEDPSPSARYEITPFVFVKVRPDFFQQTFNKPSHGRYQREASSEMPNVVVAGHADEADLRRRHLESGWVYLEHWWWGWVGCNIHSEEPLQFSEPDVFGRKLRHAVGMSGTNESLINTIKNSPRRSDFARFLGVADQFA